MHESTRSWSGDDWEAYVVQLLRLHYPVADLVEVPDRDRGDAGLEAFTADGCAYQCYAPEEPLSVDDRYSKQRDKMTRDIAKFKTPQKLLPLLGRVEIRRWFLVVPTADSRRIVEFANTKAAEVRSEGLSYVAHDFEILVITDERFEQERAQLVRLGINAPMLGTTEPSVERLAEYAEAQGEHMQNLDRKLSKISSLAAQPARAEYINEMLAAFLRGSDARGRLQTDFPELARPVDEAVAVVRRSLVLRHRLSAGPAEVTLVAVVEELRQGILACLPGLRGEDVENIAYSATAQWIMECPLDFAGAPA